MRKEYINAMTSALKQANCCNSCPLENFKKFEQNHVFVSQPAGLPTCLSTGTDLEPILLSIKPSNFPKISAISVGTNLCYSNGNSRCVPWPILCSFIQIN